MKTRPIPWDSVRSITVFCILPLLLISMGCSSAESPEKSTSAHSSSNVTGGHSSQNKKHARGDQGEHRRRRMHAHDSNDFRHRGKRMHRRPRKRGAPAKVNVPGTSGGTDDTSPETDTAVPGGNGIKTNSHSDTQTGKTFSDTERRRFERGQKLYSRNCSSCHGRTLSGNPPQYPSLQTVTDRLSDRVIKRIITNGKGFMPSFPHLDTTEQQAIIFLLRNYKSRSKVGDAQ